MTDRSIGGMGNVFSTNLQLANLAFRMAHVVGSMYLMILGESYLRYMASDLWGPMVHRCGLGTCTLPDTQICVGE